MAPDGVFGAGTLSAWRSFSGDKKAEGAALEDLVWVPEGFAPVKCELAIGDSVAGPAVPALGEPQIVSFTISGALPAEGAERVVVVGSERLPVAGSEITDADAIATLITLPTVIAALATEEASVAATIELVAPLESARVSAAAIITNGDKVCVASAGKTYPVKIIDSALGRTVITFDSEVPSEIDLDRRVSRC